MKITAASNPREVLDIQQAAEYLGIAADTLYKYAAEGSLPAFKLGNRWRFRLTHINEWIDRKAYEHTVYESELRSSTEPKREALIKTNANGRAKS
jgi:excisionase family DNA binding protein